MRSLSVQRPFLCMTLLVLTAAVMLLQSTSHDSFVVLAAAKAVSDDIETSGEDLALDGSSGSADVPVPLPPDSVVGDGAEAEASYAATAKASLGAPIPCESLQKAAALPLKATMEEIVRLVGRLEEQKDKTTGALPCPTEDIETLRLTASKGFGDLKALHRLADELHAVGINGYMALGAHCSTDLLVASSLTSRWASEAESFVAALAHTEESCPVAWAHMLAFMNVARGIEAPVLRSEDCMGNEEYRRCFEVAE